MGFFDLFKPKWKHSNPEIRKAAIDKITDQSILADILKNDSKFAKVYLKEKEMILDQMNQGNQTLYKKCLSVLKL